MANDAAQIKNESEKARVLPIDAGQGFRLRPHCVMLIGATSLHRQAVSYAIAELGYEIIEAGFGGQAIRELGHRKVDIVVINGAEAAADAANLCRAIKTTPGCQTIPIALINGAPSVEDEVRAIESGADVFLSGSLHARTLRARLQAMLQHKKLMDSLDETEGVLCALAQSVEQRDPALGHHCERLSLIAANMGMALGLSPNDIVALQRGGYLHDVGKIAIPDSVLLKPGKLTPEEWDIMKSHTEKGEKICSAVRSLRSVLPIIRHHHERWDGTGYPDKLKGEEIPLLARILQYADIYDALTAERPYKRAYTPEEAMQTLREEAAKGWRDPHLFPIFESVVQGLSKNRYETDMAASLKSLSDTIERYRKSPLTSASRAFSLAPQVQLLASGL